MENVKKKILFLITQSEMGGAQRFIFEIIQGLNPKDYRFLVAAGEGDDELFEKILKLKIQNPELKIQKLKYLKRVPNPLFFIAALIEIATMLKKERPEILFLCSTTAGLLGSIASLVCKDQTFIIYRIGGWAFRDPRFWLLNKIIFLAEKLTAPLKDKIIVNSEIDRQLAIKYKIAPAEKIVKIYNGIDIKNLDFLSQKEARQKLALREEKIVGTVANFYKTKGLEYLIEAAKEAEVNLIVIGEGKLRPRLEAKIEKLGLKDKVILAGRIPDAYRYLKAFDLFVLPSLKEGFPWILLEAMAAQVPILATKTGAIPEMIEEEKEGILVEPKDVKALAQKIEWFLKNQNQAKSLAERARKKAENFSLEKMIKATQDLL